MSSKRAQRRRQCGDKRRFDSADSAHAAVQWGWRHGDRLLPYRCQFCGAWHVGHPPARVRQAMASRRKASNP